MQSQRFIISSCNQKENLATWKKCLNNRKKKHFFTQELQLLHFKVIKKYGSP